MKNKVSVSCVHKRFGRLKKDIEKTCNALLKLVNKKNSFLEVYLVGNGFVNRDSMRKARLRTRFARAPAMRKRPREFNVLAFPAPKNFPRPDIRGKFLGEIYLNPDYIKKQNQDIFFMVLHGFLHLLGYDHKKKNDTIKMEKKERELFKKL